VTTIHLQGIGNHIAKPAADLAIGDLTVWNYGTVERVTAIAPKGKASLTLTVTSADGREWSRTIRSSRLVAVTTR
jgi:hypothetical protein